MILVKPSHNILTGIEGDRILRRIERAGRTCYKSEDKVTTDSAKTFVKGLLKRGHESVIEHENISVKIICDRGVTHEIVRHRLCAYSQESTRYCNYKGGVTFVIPPWLKVGIEPGEWNSDKIIEGTKMMAHGYSTDHWLFAIATSEKIYLSLLDDGWSPQQARSVLPNSLKTEIVMTANIREWRHILKLRTSKAAHPQMREVMIPILVELNDKIPILFDGIWTGDMEE